ncbi:MAG: MaoC family dehydratase [Pseudoxanthomonas sp.]
MNHSGALREAAARRLREWCDRERCAPDWIVIEQTRIDAFAEATEDRYWLHTQPERARSESPFGGTIAHGFLLLSLTVGDDVTDITRLPGVAQLLNYGLDKVRFLMPVKCGARIRVRSKFGSLAEKDPGRWLLRQIKTIEVQGQPGPALVAEQLTLIALR